MNYKNSFVFILVIYYVTTTLNGINANGCPPKCGCQQRNVRCIRQEMEMIPEVPLDTSIIDLRFNRIKEIPSNSFYGMIYLHTIFLNSNQITSVNDAAFKDITSLKYLYLNQNKINSIAPNAFHNLEALHSLYLEDNNISEFDSQTFSNMPRLERLFLQNNKIQHIQVGSFGSMNSLKRIRIDNNNLICDCAIIWFIKVLHQKKNSLNAAVTCMNGRNLAGMAVEDFSCKKPEIVQNPTDIEASLGSTVVLNCIATGDPQPSLTWMLNSKEIVSSDPRISISSQGSMGLLQIEKTVFDDQGKYVCMAKSDMGEAVSRPARMTIIENSSDSLRINYDTVVSQFEEVIMHCHISGNPQPQILWHFNEIPLVIHPDHSHIYDNGSLIIKRPIENDEGTYKCISKNFLGSTSIIAQYKLSVPEIIVAPEYKKVNSGSTVILSCEADGSPKPRIWWKKDEKNILTTNRISYTLKNTQLNIDHAKPSDSGSYVCVAENALGSDEAATNLDVSNSNEPPTIIYEPYDIDAIPGSTIELPCQAESDLTTKWKKDGRSLTQSINPVKKYGFSATGSLHITNIEEQDSGRYECTILNDFGRATASAVVSVRRRNELAPGDKFVRIAFSEASKEVARAINQTIQTLFSNSSSSTRHHSDLFRIVRFPSGPARELARASEIYERTLVNIRRHVNMGMNLTANVKNFNYTDLLSIEYLELLAQLSDCMAHRVTPNCTDMCFHAKYRTLDGTCNNFKNPMYGSSLTGFRRILPPKYENGFNIPKGWSKSRLYNGFKMPSARLVSTSVISTTDVTPDDTITHMVMQWGQFLDHDLDHAIPSVSSESWDGVDCKKTCDHAAPCYPIEIPPNDPRVNNRRCIDFVRSSATCGSGMTSVFFGTIQPREQINQLTSYIDASQVYGYSEQFSRDLRNLTNEDNGYLREGVHFPNQKSLLPFTAPTDGVDCRRDLGESTVNCFTAGDVRANEQLGLLTMHTIFMREHNRIAEFFNKINPTWVGERVYQESRKIVGAMMQHITYEHWLPHIIGREGLKLMGDYKAYDETIDPSISNEFATAAMRFGHSLINPELQRLNWNFEPIEQGHLPLHKAFFAPWRLVYEGGVDPLLRGLFNAPAKLKLPAESLNKELTEKLFQNFHSVALDLAAINIQRSRDHAIPSYTEYRKICNLPMAKSFDDLKNEISSSQIRDKLKEIYGNVSNIDIWVGGILEDQIQDARVGPTFRCLLVEQFKKLRDGDRFWYENPSVFKANELLEIKRASLGKIICDNGDNITRVTNDIFILPSLQGGYKICKDIPEINLRVWTDCSECSRSAYNLDVTSVPKRNRVRRSASNLNNDSLVQNILYNENFAEDDMKEERIEGLEILIEQFQKSLEKVKRKLRKLNETCTAAVFGNNNNLKVISEEYSLKKSHVHCFDDKQIKRLNNEIWMKDDCTKCECQHHQITCTIENCKLDIKCPNGWALKRGNGKCCPECVKRNDS